MKTKLFIISLLSCAVLTHNSYQIAAAAPDPRNPIQSRVLGDHTDWVNSVAFSPDDSKLATGSEDRTTYIGVYYLWQYSAYIAWPSNK
jgi:WD40 repeat protein